VQVICFLVGEVEYALDIMRVTEVVVVPAITRAPKLPRFVEGLMELRGEFLPVIDLRRCFGLPSAQAGKCVIAALDRQRVGLLVDTVQSVERLAPQSVAPAPEALTGDRAGYLAGLYKLGERALLLIDLDQLLTAAERAELLPTEQNRL
jgi:purine-binding chemotaxis protein CheW